MKSILVSIQPRYCELIINGNKTIELRKTIPKLATPFKVYIYMTKSYDTIFGKGNPKRLCVGGGKVIGEFVCDKIDRMGYYGTNAFDIRLRLVDKFFNLKELDEIYLSECKLSYSDIEKYSKGGNVYGWHISNLILYDKPKELSEFSLYNASVYLENGLPMPTHKIKKAPQSWYYVNSL